MMGVYIQALMLEMRETIHNLRGHFKPIFGKINVNTGYDVRGRGSGP